MVPRADIEAVDMNMTIGALMIHFEETGRSRMPVYVDNLDDARGFVHIRDLLSYLAKQARNKRRVGARASAQVQVAGVAEKADKPIRTPKAAFDLGRVNLEQTVGEAGLVRKLLFVPPSMLASDLLRSMQAARTQLALVIDEYGGTDGLVSHEDIVEMVIGDVEDEHDSEEVMFSQTGDDIFVADARIELEEIAKAIGHDFDIRDRLEDVDTLGGLIFSALGRIPVRGEVVQAVPGFEFQILDADPRRIKRVRILRKRALARRRQAKGEGELLIASSVPAGLLPAPSSDNTSRPEG
jgi:CBS domain containing-hemolysin-like protein